MSATPPTWRIGAAIVRRRPGRFGAGAALWTVFFALPAAVGLLLQAVFDTIAGRGPAGLDVPTLLALLAAVEATRLVVFLGGIVVFTGWWVRLETLLRANLLRAQLASRRRAQGAPVRSAPEAIPVFRDDVDDLLRFVDLWIDLVGVALFAGIALAVMARVDAVLALVVVLPLTLVTVVTGVLAERIRRVRRRDREATAAVTGFLGSAYASVLALKVAGAEEHAVARLRALNARRRRTAVADRVLGEAVEAFSGSSVDLAIGLVLLLAASSMREGTFTVGDLALFTSYLTSLAMLPHVGGLLLARLRHAQVSATRMGALLPGADARAAVAPQRVRLDGSPPAPRARPPRPAPAEVALDGFGTADGRVADVDLRLAPGSFTVLCGAVGSGKSSLVRALLGLAGATAGVVRWNGEEVDDLAAHMTPPRCAYVPQVPRLFSATLRENLTVGLATSEASLGAALHGAAFTEDLATMQEGLDTLLGPRGVRLSGGQLQRAATGRALVAAPALLVLDDLSSALDAATEREVWSRIADEGRATVLAVSHRAGALERADQIVVLDGGRVRAVGTLEELRATGCDPLAG